PALDPAMRTHERLPFLPYLWFGIGGHEQQRPAAGAGYRFSEWQASVTADRYATAFTRIQQHIHDGDTYQINFTFPLRSTFSGDVAALYNHLRREQAADWCASIHAPERDIVSSSPELFFTRAGDRILTRPMKGT